jgi:hypothetical protein
VRYIEEASAPAAAAVCQVYIMYLWSVTEWLHPRSSDAVWNRDQTQIAESEVIGMDTVIQVLMFYTEPGVVTPSGVFFSTHVVADRSTTLSPMRFTSWLQLSRDWHADLCLIARGKLKCKRYRRIEN